ncbi:MULTISPECIES: Cof-type HAD-IIB family hydrolase [unclassified Paenibacillus]|uniref:Cof-type HAD-IIB family hydrolase n=1 Tax=unclassified Paenibacillus TaxID=185978 RepID=UPI001C112C53|nr:MULTISPECIES: Cof-type HAD-IIB family hydrolase [unclassified Paenibacillus]MBU5444189.1 Cof-type HAD-IIB family hydrolase [Paenibacillus sp. MSJ-34]CAH0122533.1 Putative phosphatase [Paenibacillus sp. CECT 9249]
MYRMIAIDIDDTLLNDDMIITDETKQAIRDAIDNGIVVTLATGRMYPSAVQIARQLDLNVPLITYQGAKIKNLLDQKTVYERFVPQPIVQAVFDYARRQGLHLQVYHDDILYSREDHEFVRTYSDTLLVPYTVAPNFDGLADKPLNKLLIADRPDKVDCICEELMSMFGQAAYITKSKPEYVEVLHVEATKGHALEYLASHYEIPMAQVIAIGDSWNDHEMIERAGLGVAMGNAIPSLQRLADYVTLTNNLNGVAHVIRKFMLDAR